MHTVNQRAAWMFNSAPLPADVNINDGGSAFHFIFWRFGGSSMWQTLVLSPCERIIFSSAEEF